MSFEQVIDELNQFFTGWVAYFRYAEAQSPLEKLNGWVRRKLRCLRLKQCRFTAPIARLLKNLGVPSRRAWLLAQSGRGGGDWPTAPDHTRECHWHGLNRLAWSTCPRDTSCYKVERNRRIR